MFCVKGLMDFERNLNENELGFGNALIASYVSNQGFMRSTGLLEQERSVNLYFCCIS